MCAFHSVRNKTLKREKENFQKFPQKFNRCPKRSYLRTNEQSSLSLCPRQRQSKGKFSSFCLGREKPWLELWRKEGRAEEYFLIRAIKAAQRMRLKKREKDESLIRRSFYRGETGFEPFFAEERAKGAGHVGSPQPFSGARGQKRRVRGPSR